jgi:hypothetical protein
MIKMKKENSKTNPLTISIILVIATVILIGGSIIYNSNHKIEEWVVCDYTGTLPGYKETIKFRYMYDVLYGYYENKEIQSSSEEAKEKIIEQLNSFGSNLPTSDDIKFEITEEDLLVKSNFYVKTISYNFIDDYFNEMGISMESTPNDIVDALKNEYNCKITRK